MKSNQIKLFAILLIALGGIGYFLNSVYRSFATPPPQPLPSNVDEAGSLQLESAEQFLTPLTPQDRAEIPDRLAEAARSTSSDTRDNLLLDIFRDRIAVMVDPSYERYIAHVAAITRQSEAAVLASLGNEYRRLWEPSARLFRDASFGLDGCEIQAGDRVLNRYGGVVITMNDPGVYESAALLADSNAELRQVRVPVILSAYFGDEQQTLLLYLIMGFVWDSARSTWIPHVTGLHDPTDQENRLPAPWI